jgi:hypothetical protein
MGNVMPYFKVAPVVQHLQKLHCFNPGGADFNAKMGGPSIAWFFFSDLAHCW